MTDMTANELYEFLADEGFTYRDATEQLARRILAHVTTGEGDDLARATDLCLSLVRLLTITRH